VIVAGHPFTHPDDPAAEMIYLSPYVPWSWHKLLGGSGWDWDGDSSRILDLKKSKPYALEHYAKRIAAEASKPYTAVSAVPSHDPAGSSDTGARLLAKMVADRLQVADGRSYLRRTRVVDKLTGGGNRAADVHLGSIVVDDPDALRGGHVLLLDDVLTSGNSMLACRRILLNAGASSVLCLALGKTQH
jgi:predicted amidophosphoribosyltransferase